MGLFILIMGENLLWGIWVTDYLMGYLNFDYVFILTQYIIVYNISDLRKQKFTFLITLWLEFFCIEEIMIKEKEFN